MTTLHWLNHGALNAGGGFLLADLKAWRRMGDRFTGVHLELQTEDVIGFIAIVVIFAALFLLLRGLAAWQRKTSARPNPKRLFAELAATHRLGRSDQSRLRALARAGQIANPAEVFVRPEALRGPVAEGAVEPSALEALRDRLFNEEADG